MALSQGYGVPAMHASTTQELEDALRKALTRTDGPVLIEMRLP
jgi:thiamine pyrophosphate-dependent acetolactate synthase large subunit-like protein